MAEARGERAVVSGQWELAQQLHARARTEPIGVSKAGSLGCSGACQVGTVGLGLVCFGWVALMSLLRSDGRFDVAVFRGSVPVPELCLCLCSDETWGRERQAVGALSTLA